MTSSPRILATLLAWMPAALGTATGAPAQEGGEPLVTDRPDATESAAVVAPGRLQLEAGYTATRSAGTTLHALGEALLRVGVADGVEARIGLHSYQVTAGEGPDAEGLADASVGTKVVLREEPRGPAPRLALLADAILPTGSGGFGADGVQPGGMVALSWNLSPRTGLGANVGYRYADDGPGRFDEIRTSLALGVGLTGTAAVFVEYFADHRPAEGRPSEVSADGGITLLLGPDLQLDARAGVGLNAAAPDYLVGAGVAIRR